MIKAYAAMEEAVTEFSGKYSFALVYMMSCLLLCRTSELPELMYDEILEARFFDEKGEAHICTDDGEIRAYIFSESDIEAGYKKDEDIFINKDFQNRYNKLKTRRYYNFDEDGQKYCVLTRCIGIEG
ncbi:MAG: hypothetical protein E7505_09905 [Ruminococcus sp.]|nr:hypothetical protein [Ruminococcus sp.]